MPYKHPPRISRHTFARLRNSRPSMVWAASLLYLCRGLACFATVAFPISAREPVQLDLAVGALACLVGVGLWTLARNAPPILIQLLMALERGDRQRDGRQRPHQRRCDAGRVRLPLDHDVRGPLLLPPRASSRRRC